MKKIFKTAGHGTLIGLAAVANWYIQPFLPNVTHADIVRATWTEYLPMIWSIIVPTTIGYAAGLIGKAMVR